MLIGKGRTNPHLPRLALVFPVHPGERVPAKRHAVGFRHCGSLFLDGRLAPLPESARFRAACEFTRHTLRSMRLDLAFLRETHPIHPPVKGHQNVSLDDSVND